MGLPNRTTAMQQHAQYLRDRFWLASDGHVYMRENNCQITQHRNRSGTCIYSVRLPGEGPSRNLSANAFRWLLGTGKLPNGHLVLVTPRGLACGQETMYWSEAPNPPNTAARPTAKHSRAGSASANAEERIRRLMRTYDRTVAELATLDVDPVRRVRTTTRTITEEVPL